MRKRAPCRRSAAATFSRSISPPSDQCTDEIEARPAGGGSARALVLRVGERGVEYPGSGFAENRSTAGLLGFQRQRAVGGRIQVADMARHLEQVALAGKHWRLTGTAETTE